MAESQEKPTRPSAVDAIGLFPDLRPDRAEHLGGVLTEVLEIWAENATRPLVEIVSDFELPDDEQTILSVTANNLIFIACAAKIAEMGETLQNGAGH